MLDRGDKKDLLKAIEENTKELRGLRRDLKDREGKKPNLQEPKKKSGDNV